MINSTMRFFDLYSQNKDDSIRPHGDNEDVNLSGWRQLFIYLACVIGIFIGPFAVEAASGTYPTIKELLGSPTSIFFSIVIGFVLVAAIFKLKWISAKTPFVIQIGTAIIAGIVSGKLLPFILEIYLKLTQ